MSNYSTSYDYSLEYSAPSASTYFYSPISPTSCPVHSSYNLYTPTSPSMHIFPLIPNDYQQTQVFFPPPAQQQSTVHPGADRTPLRRHRCFKKNEIQILHQAYIRDPHPSTDVLQQLASQLKGPLDKQWFKNRRHSDKQKKREIATACTSLMT